jgi:pimeloyl-ACP methyl ester carboxylesterase
MTGRISLLILGLAGLIGAVAARQEPRADPASGFFTNGDVRLSYQLDRPAAAGPLPAVVFGHGSGRTTKETCRGLATRFLERGYATLCYDKRGVGASTGRYDTVGPGNSPRMIADLAGDMAAGVAFLRGQPGIDGRRIGLVGGSQAGWIIPAAAARSQPAFMIMLVGPTVSVGEEIFYSRLIEKSTMPLEEGYAQLPSFRGERGFDPRPVLETLNVPGLWLLGAEDRSIPTPKTVAILDEMKASGRPFSYVIFPGFGHDLNGAPIWDAIDRWLATTKR